MTRSEKTHGKIRSILDAPNKDLVMALINALYFNGKWAFEFDGKIIVMEEIMDTPADEALLAQR